MPSSMFTLRSSNKPRVQNQLPDQHAKHSFSKITHRPYEKKITQAARVGKQTGRWLKIEHYRFLKGKQHPKRFHFLLTSA